jgi:hypothetical protein
MNTHKIYYVTTTANTRGRHVAAKNARSAKTIYKNLTGNTAGQAREAK